MDIYEVTVKGTRQNVTFQVIGLGMWDVWEQFDHLNSSRDFPNVGLINEISFKYISPLYA